MESLKSTKSPRTTAERQRKRRKRLNKIAQAHGFDSWGKLETAAINNEITIKKTPQE